MAARGKMSKTRRIDPKAVGKRIRYLRQKQGLSIAELGRRTGIINVKISGFEAFSICFNEEALLRIAKVLKVDLGYLLTGNKATRFNGNTELRVAFDRFLQLSPRKCSCGQYALKHLPVCERCDAKRKPEAVAYCECGRPMSKRARLCAICRSRNFKAEPKYTDTCICGNQKSIRAKHCKLCHSKGRRKFDPQEALKLYEQLLDYSAVGRKLGVTHEAVRQAVAKERALHKHRKRYR
jgi:transcriptional regulator with XRE-family HTH domain